jgi:chaperone modulatory protein CbpM
MITVERILVEFHDLDAAELNRWIDNAWVRPEGPPGRYRFHEIDRARIRLILDLRDTLEVPEPALPTVLSLLDQLYEARRHMHRLNRALGNVPEDVRAVLVAALRE